jgi:hypothetical protein
MTYADGIQAAQAAASGLHHATTIVQAVCRLAGPASLIDDIRADLDDNGVLTAVDRHDTGALFDWLINGLSYQGIANRIASDYIERHGQATWADIQRHLEANPSCPKLRSYWHFYDCRYQKGSGTCREPDHIDACPVPSHDLRNGRLNQTAYSLALFMRDIAGCDFVTWIDDQLTEADDPTAPDRLRLMRQALLEPLRQVCGASDKVWSMTLASLLMGAGKGRPAWLEVGGSMVAVDTLVHNFLHRTGILGRLNASHSYGPGCYRPSGCADVLQSIARAIDAREFNPSFPKTFPRFVQVAVWSYCAEDVFDTCNGNRINDRQRCSDVYCRIRRHCDRIALYKSAE